MSDAPLQTLHRKSLCAFSVLSQGHLADKKTPPKQITDAGVTGPLSGPRLRFRTKARVPLGPQPCRGTSLIRKQTL